MNEIEQTGRFRSLEDDHHELKAKVNELYGKVNNLLNFWQRARLDYQYVMKWRMRWLRNYQVVCERMENIEKRLTELEKKVRRGKE